MHAGSLALALPERQACRGWIKQHSKSFYLSSLLLPARVRHASWALYAFCRRADDAVDDRAGDPFARIDLLRRRLDDVYAGRELADPVDRAFRVITTLYEIPRALPEALFAGMEMDARGARYECDEDLLVYCFRVASTVGLMMTKVMGCMEPRYAYVRAANLGVAMQLTNICRDVGEDARMGRVYLPDSLCHEVGLDKAKLRSAPAPEEPVRRAVERLLDRADEHYRAAETGIPLLPLACRLAIASSRHIYSAIGQRVRQNRYDSVTQRAFVPLAGKLGLVLRSFGSLFAIPAGLTSLSADDRVLGRLVAEVGLPGPPLLDRGDLRPPHRAKLDEPPA